MSSSEEEDDSNYEPRERSASYAGSKTLELLGELGSAKHAGRIKALKRFQEYISKYRPELYDDDVELLYVGSSTLVGLIPWCGQRAQKGDGLKTTSRSVLQLVLWLVSQKAENMGGENLFLEKFLELSEDELKKMQLSMHIRSSEDSEAFELLFLLLSRHKSPDGQSDQLDLDALLPDEEARRKFTRWLQQSATEQQLMDRIEATRSSKATAAALAASGSNSKSTTPRHPVAMDMRPPLSRDAQRSGVKSVDPLGLQSMDLISAQQARAQSTQGAVGPQSAKRGGSSILTARERINLLQKLQQAPFGGGVGSGLSGPSSAKKYTRNRARAVRVQQTDLGRQGAAGASIVPQEEGFDPIFFLTVVHGSSSFADLKRGQENLEAAMGTQANLLQQLVREHYDNFVSCADGIHWFKNMIAEESMAKGQAGDREASRVAKLLTIVSDTKEGARKLFSPLLERMDKTRSLRSARLMLQRLAKVLDVPGRMAKFIKAGQYEEVVREYERVKALPLGGGMHLLVRVQEQAECVASELRAKLLTYVASEPHNSEDLVEASDLLGRLGGVPEPLLHCFAKQAELLAKALDGWDEWYSNALDGAVQKHAHAQQHDTLGHGDWDDEEDEDEDDDEESSAGGDKDKAKRRLSVLHSPDGLEEDHSDDDSDFSLDDSEHDERRHMDLFATGFALNSLEHEVASLRLNYVRKVAKEATRFLPTLLRLAALVADELQAVKLLWEPGHYTFTVLSRDSDASSSSSSNASANKRSSYSAGPGAGTEGWDGAVTAPRAVLDHVMGCVTRLCRSSRVALFGGGGGVGEATGVVGHALEAAYFRVALRCVAELYELVFNLDADDMLGKAVLPPLKTLLEDAQKKQTSSVLERLAAEVLRLPLGEDWAAGQDGGPGTRLPERFYTLVHRALEELAGSLLRPFWCANQAAAGLSTCVTNVLRSLEALASHQDLAMPANSKLLKCPPPELRLLALVGDCIQLDRKYIPRLAEETASLFEVEHELAYSGAVFAVHEALLRSYQYRKAQDMETALRTGWLLKLKGIKTSFGPKQSLPVPGYLVQMLMILIRVKTEVGDALQDLPLLVDFSSADSDASATYVDTAMANVIQTTYAHLMKKLEQLIHVLEAQKKRTGAYGEIAHMTVMESEFLINCLFKPHLSQNILQNSKGPLSKLKALAADGLNDDDEETDHVLEYTAKHLADVNKMYVASLARRD